MAKKSAGYFISMSNLFIASQATKEKYRVSEVDFTRNRKLTFSDLSLCMIRLLRQNIQIELNKYFNGILNSVSNKVHSITSSAFVQSRKKLKPDMFYDLNMLIAEDFYLDNDEQVKLYKGHRLIGVDGSIVNLPVTEETRSVYGTYNNQKKTNDIVLGQGSIMYDLLNEIVLDGKLCAYTTSEISLLRQHIQIIKKNDVLIMDRGYPSFESMYAIQAKEAFFIVRCSSTFSNAIVGFIKSGEKDFLTELKPNKESPFKNLPYNKDTTIKVRMLSIELSSGENEILITSLSDTKPYPYEDFKALYFKRWGIETFYNRFKNIIEVEKFSGTSDQFIQQEFNCALYMCNLQSILTKDAQREANEKYKDRVLEYKINSSLSLCFIREKLIQIFTNQKESDNILDELKTLFIQNVIPVRPGRSNVRDPEKYRKRGKPKQFKNRRTNL